jgi:hypothetical protein
MPSINEEIKEEKSSKGEVKTKAKLNKRKGARK